MREIPPRRSDLALLAILLALVPPACAAADSSSATQAVQMAVLPIRVIAISDAPPVLVRSHAAAGQEPDGVTEASTTYALTTNETNLKITGRLGAPLPADVSLTVSLAAPTGASSVGEVALGATDVDLVTGISKLAESGRTISLRFAAPVSAGVASSTLNSLVLTLTDGS
jgi:hypothetical protein